MSKRTGTILSTLVATLALAAGPAGATPPRPADLSVVGGNSWHPHNVFSLTWTSPPTGSPALASTHYRIRNSQGTLIEQGQVNSVEDGLGGLAVPKIPGAYGVEVWFEDTAGGLGPVATTTLRFDDVQPASVTLQTAPEWVGRTALPLRVHIGHPKNQPLSGIRGYAASIDRAPIGAPCSAADRCTDAETNLRGGVGDDALTVGSLPEGTSYLHAVAVSGSGMKSATSEHTTLRVDLSDPITRLTGAPPDWTNRAVSLTAMATDNVSGMTADGNGQPPFTAIRVDRGTPAVTVGASASTRVIAEGIHLIEYYARDGAGNVNDGALANGISNHLPRTTLVRIDRTPPTLAFANSEDPRDPDLLRAWIGDRLSGADPSRGWIGVRRLHSGDSFRRLPRAPSANGELRARWDSDSYPLGEYEFQATAYDKAGNASVASRRRDGATMVLTNPLKATTKLVATFDGSSSERTVPYGRGVHLSGRLTTGIRSPLAAAPVRIVERFAAGRGPGVRVSTAKTGPGGAYSVHLPPGPSREISASFAGSPTLSRSASRPLRLEVRSAVRLGASSAVAEVGGSPLVFRGRVLPPEAIPEGGKAVQLQFRLPGLPWSEFRTVQTDRHGRFRYAYRFSDDDSRGARFQFRAYAPAQDDWPYEPAGSRPVIVQGR